MIRSACALGLLGFALLGCDKGGDIKPSPTTSATAALSVAPTASASAAPAPAPNGAVQTWGKSVGFKTPESVLHDTKSDIYFISNIDGNALDADGKAFIAKVAPEQLGVDLHYIEGGQKGVTLNAPKGMALTGDVLWVADIDTVRTFDRKSGAPKGDVKVPGATFLNDIAVAADGTSIYVSDTGMKADKDKGLVPANTDAVYKIDKDKKLTTIAKSKDLGHPNGLYVSAGTLWVVTFGSNELYALDEKGVRSQITKLPKGQLDGIAMINADFLISSWESATVYRGRPSSEFVPVIESVTSPADILFDKSRNRVVIPLFQEDEVRAYELK